MEKILGSSPNVKIISFLLDHLGEALNKTQIIQGARVGRTTFYSRIDMFVEENIVKSFGSGRTTLYQLNEGHPVISALLRLKQEGHI